MSEHTSPHVTSERQTPDTALDPRCQSGPSARNLFDPSEGRFSKNHGADQQRLQISNLHFDKFPNSATFACWKIRFKTEVCTFFPHNFEVDDLDDLIFAFCKKELKVQTLRYSTRELLQH